MPEAQGKTNYCLYRQLGMSCQNFSKIEAMYPLLNCTPNNFPVITDD